MRITKEELCIKVVVRRVRRGAAPFVWEINADNLGEPLYVSPDGFCNMEDAYRAGRARLPEFIPTPRSAPGLRRAAAMDQADSGH